MAKNSVEIQKPFFRFKKGGKLIQVVKQIHCVTSLLNDYDFSDHGIKLIFEYEK